MESNPPTKRGYWLLIALGVVLVWLHLFLPPPSSFIGLFSDSARYLLMAEHLAGVARAEVGWAAFHGSIFPPLYPVMLSLVDAEPIASHRLSAALMLLAAIPFFLFARARGGVVTASLLTAAVWLTPDFLRGSLLIWSEGQYLLLSLTAVWLAGRENGGRRVGLLLALLIAAAILTRTIGIALLPALLMWCWRQRIGGVRSGILLAVVVVPVAAWEFYKAATALGGVHYTRALFEGGVQGIAGTVVSNIAAFGALGDLFGSPWATLPVVVLASVGWWAALRDREFSAYYMAVYTIIVLLWPYPEQVGRFVVPLMPLIAFHAAMTLKHWVQRDAVRLVGVGALLAVQAPFAWQVIERMAVETSPELAGYRADPQFVEAPDAAAALLVADRLHRMVLAMQAAGAAVPAGECLYAVQDSLVLYHARVPVRPTPAPPMMRDCRYVLALAIQVTDGPAALAARPPMYPVEEAGLDFEPVWVSQDREGQAVAALLQRRQ